MIRSLRAAAALAALFCCCAFAKGERQPAEHRVFTDPDSGLEVVQLTTHPADDAVLYFTGESFTLEGALVFASRRSGSWNLFLMDLRTFESVQLTDSRRIYGPNAVVAPLSHEAFFIDGRDVKAVHLATLAERPVARIPEGYSLGAALSATADGRALAFSISENIPIASRTDKIYSDMDERFEKRPWSAVLVGSGNGTEWREATRQKQWISHTQINPRHPGLILYCHEGRWDKVEQRMWLVNADGTADRRLRIEETPALQVGHEYWFSDGDHVGYHGHVPKKFSFIGVADVRTGGFVEYPLPHGETHTHGTAGGTVFVGDGTEKAPVLTLYRLDGDHLQARPLFRHGGSFSRQEWHPHPRFSPDGTAIVLTSSSAGNGDVYLVRLRDAASTP